MTLYEARSSITFWTIGIVCLSTVAGFAFSLLLLGDDAFRHVLPQVQHNLRPLVEMVLDKRVVVTAFAALAWLAITAGWLTLRGRGRVALAVGGCVGTGVNAAIFNSLNVLVARHMGEAPDAAPLLAIGVWVATVLWMLLPGAAAALVIRVLKRRRNGREG